MEIAEESAVSVLLPGPCLAIPVPRVSLSTKPKIRGEGVTSSKPTETNARAGRQV
jgi:hypothetical protein